MPISRRLFLGSAFGVAIPSPQNSSKAKAVERGLRFIYKTSQNKKAFSDFGQDYLWCFYTISASTADPKLKKLAWTMGQNCARRWRRKNPRLPERFTAGSISYWVFADYSATLLGIPGIGNIKESLKNAAVRFRPEDFLGFNPTAGPIPKDLPKLCPKDKSRNARGATVCSKCATELRFEDPYDLLCDAIITTYSGERYGVILGARLADVTQHIPSLRPYRGPHSKQDDGFSSITYAVTHIVYALNDYGIYRLRPEWLPSEYSFLRDHILENIETGDVETLGEFMDTLKSFGLTDKDQLIRNSEQFLLRHQNPDGSWGDPKESDIYIRYHSTWTVVGGLMDFALKTEGVSIPDALERMKS